MADKMSVNAMSKIKEFRPTMDTVNVFMDNMELAMREDGFAHLVGQKQITANVMADEEANPRPVEPARMEAETDDADYDHMTKRNDDKSKKRRTRDRELGEHGRIEAVLCRVFGKSNIDAMKASITNAGGDPDRSQSHQVGVKEGRVYL
ncbi:hypothetical protein HDU76_007866, partial [Blyttiomyces sp. JEL0837]